VISGLQAQWKEVFMNRQLTSRSSLEALRKEAKRWLKALRAQDPKAHGRLRRSYPGAPPQPGLRDVQFALAREHGADSWPALKTALAETAMDNSSHEVLLAQFLEHARLRYGVRPATSEWNERYYDDPSRWKYAARILQRHPQIVTDNIHAAAVSGDLAAIERILKIRPAAASERAALDAHLPLEYVCYGRLPIAATVEHAVAIATALLDAGSPCQHVLPDDEGAHFQPLTGAIGAGEAGQPPHPAAEALAVLLIERGADPYDAQALYNLSLGDDDLFWLDFLWSRSAQRGESRKWTEPSARWPKIPIVDFLLIMAVNRNHISRAQWALAHGANPRCQHPYYARRNLHTEAIVNGHTQIADLLLQSGGLAATLDGYEAFQAACVRLDRDAAAKLARSRPEYLTNPHPLLLAASRDLREAATLLLDLGTSPDVANATNFRPLHAAASGDSVQVGTLLIERGCQIDPIETRFNATPLGWAIHGNNQRMMRILGAASRNVRALCRMGNAPRLRELFAENPELAKAAEHQASPFFALPDDEDCALEIAELLLANGADPRAVSEDGTTAVKQAQRQGLDAVADLLAISVSARHKRER
jgi:ankyrin repeat protein